MGRCEMAEKKQLENPNITPEPEEDDEILAILLSTGDDYDTETR
jgi:hypothetical protein